MFHTIVALRIRPRCRATVDMLLIRYVLVLSFMVRGFAAQQTFPCKRRINVAQRESEDDMLEAWRLRHRRHLTVTVDTSSPFC